MNTASPTALRTAATRATLAVLLGEPAHHPLGGLLALGFALRLVRLLLRLLVDLDQAPRLGHQVVAVAADVLIDVADGRFGVRGGLITRGAPE